MLWLQSLAVQTAKSLLKVIESKLFWAFLALWELGCKTSSDKQEQFTAGYHAGFLEVFRQVYDRHGLEGVEKLAAELHISDRQVCQICGEERPCYRNYCLVCGHLIQNQH